MHDFAEPDPRVIDQLDPVQKQQLLRLLIEEVRVTGWHVQIHLRIPLDPPEPEPHTPPVPEVDQRPSAHDRCQAKTVCVPLVVTDGDSYRMREARANGGAATKRG